MNDVIHKKMIDFVVDAIMPFENVRDEYEPRPCFWHPYATAKRLYRRGIRLVDIINNFDEIMSVYNCRVNELSIREGFNILTSYKKVGEYFNPQHLVKLDIIREYISGDINDVIEELKGIEENEHSRN